MTYHRRNTPNYDPNANTQPFAPVVQASPGAKISSTRTPQPKRKPSSRIGCAGCLLLILASVLVAAVYFLAPLRTNLLILGTDRTSGSDIGRSDTIILVTVVPMQPYVGMLSIPRDLWVPIPGHGENRINTAHFFAELDHPGSGPQAAIGVVEDSFKVNIPYYLRIQFSGFKDVVNAMGGIDVDLPKPMATLPAGRHHLDGDQALAFVRERETSDDFFRMADGQLLIKAAFKQMLSPANWPRIPAVAGALSQVVTTDVPVWQWPRVGLAVLRAGPGGIDSRTITREMVKPFITTGGADVLAPDWPKIRPVVSEMFGVR